MHNRNIKDIFIENLTVMMLLQGKKSSDLASFLNVSKSTVSMWFSKKNLPRMELLDDIADYLDISVSELVHDNRIDLNNNPIADETIFSKREFTKEELEEIRKFAEFVKSKRKITKPAPISQSTTSNVTVNAAHADNYADAPEELKEREEKMMDDEDF